MTLTTWPTQITSALTRVTVVTVENGQIVEASTDLRTAVIEEIACISNLTEEEVTVIETACMRVTDVLEGHLGRASTQTNSYRACVAEKLAHKVSMVDTQVPSEIKCTLMQDNTTIGTIIARRTRKEGKHLSVKMVNSIMQKD